MGKRTSDPCFANPSASSAAAAEGRLRRGTLRADRIGLLGLLLLAAALTVLTPAALSAGLRPTVRAASACSVGAAAVTRAATDGSNRGLTASVRGQLNNRGELIGRVLNAPTANGGEIAVQLPVESFVDDAIDDVVVYTSYRATAGSQVRAIDLVSGCDSLLASPSEIVRSAAISPDGASLYVHRVKQAGRADAGVTRYDLANGAATQVLPALRPNDELGPIFGTGLYLRADGGALVVQSCGMHQCLTRVRDMTTCKVATYDEPAQGQFISIDDEHLVTYTACGAMPCDVATVDLATGTAEVQR